MNFHELFDYFAERSLWVFVIAVFIFLSHRAAKEWDNFCDENSSKQREPDLSQPPSVSDAPMAKAIWQDTSSAHVQHMLTCLQTALKQHGYQLTFHGNGVEMLPHLEAQVADKLMCARERYWAPDQSRDDIERLLVSTRKSGYSKKMLRDMLASCARQNWYVTATKSNRELLAYPLKQVEIRVRGVMGTPVTDLLPCLEFLAEFVGDRPLKSNPQHIHRRGRYRSAQADSPDVEYEMRLREINAPPGFFPDAAGTHLPPCAMQEKDNLRTSLNTQVTVFVQGTSAPGTGTGARAAFYQDALRQIKDGKGEGAAFDDDSGYTFFVNRTHVHLSV